MNLPDKEKVTEALATVNDPEINKPITDLGMVRSIDISDDGAVRVGIDLTIPGCPLKDKIGSDVRAAVGRVEGVSSVSVEFGAMSTEQREALGEKLRGGVAEPEIPFTKPGCLTRVYAVASGKGGVGKSSVTANLAVALSEQGLKVGVVDADIHGFSIPRMLGVENPPTQIDNMIIPPVAHGVKVISIGMFTPGGRPVVWRGPMLHRALQQFLADVFWGDLDVLLLDLPPGTGDIAISIAQLLPGSELIVVTTPQAAAAEVAERSGVITAQTGQKVLGVVENMSWLEQPDGSRLELFGSGGGEEVARRLSEGLGYSIDVLAQIPIDVGVREGGDLGKPIVTSKPKSQAAQTINQMAEKLAKRSRGLAGRPLGLQPKAK